MLYPSENDSCLENGHNPTHDSASLLSGNECRMSPSPAGTNLCTWCYFSHASLLALHVAVLIVYNFHTEHRITITTATIADVVATILTVSLQSFYTVYTAVLVFVTQRLALSYNFSRRQKLTSIHDISGAWIGIGAAVSGLWDQRKIQTSMRASIAITVYLLSISALHITSSSIIQLQTFNATISMPISTTVGWPDESIDLTNLTWSSITPFIPASSQLATLPTAGLSQSTIYDLVSPNPGFGKAMINATTISASCGLINSSVVRDSAQDTVKIQVKTDTWLIFNSFPEVLWKDQIRMITPAGQIVLSNRGEAYSQYPAFSNNIYIMLSTAIDLNSSLLNTTTLLVNWTYLDVDYKPQTSITKIYIIGCTLSSNTRQRYADVQTNELVDPAPLPDADQQWTSWTTQNTSTLDETISAAISSAGPSPAIFTYPYGVSTGPGPIPNASLSVLEAYMMSLFRLNATTDVLNAQFESSSNPKFSMSPYQLENAVARISAEALWMAGQLGEGGGGFSRTTGETSVMRYVLQWRLNINLAPLIIATSASFITFILAIEVTGRTGTHKPDGSHSDTVKSASPLELLWLAAHMPGLAAGFKDVKKPTMNNLRKAGMFDVCLTSNGANIFDDDLNKDTGA